MSTTPAAHQITPAEHFVATGQATRTQHAPAADIPDPLPTYGDVRAPTPGVLATAPAIHRYVFHDAVVHEPQGAITIGRRVVAETLAYTPAPFALQHGSVWIHRRAYVGATLPHAEHLLCAVPENYWHWLLDGFARSVTLPPRHAPRLLPWTGAPYQTMPSARLVHPGQSIAVARLGWSTDPTSNGGALHPALLALRDVFPPTPRRGVHDLYIARTDSPKRPLRNEAEIQDLCHARGFTPVVLSGMSLPDQVALFAAARRIVAPHGAGLANLVFCHPGAAILELMMDQYANFCPRRLAATAGLRWGAVIGPSEPGDPDWIHGTGWSIDPARVAAVLDDPNFAPT